MKSLPCPRCKEKPTVEINDWIGEAIPSLYHVCRYGFNVRLGPCVSEKDSKEFWNYFVEVELARKEPKAA